MNLHSTSPNILTNAFILSLSQQAVKCIELLLLRKTRCLVKDYGNNLQNVRTNNLIDPRTYCKLGHFNLLLENYSKGIFQKIDRDRSFFYRMHLVNPVMLTDLKPLQIANLNLFYFQALSAYQKYFSLVEDNWRVSFTV